MIVASTRKNSADEVDLNLIEEQVDALSVWSERITEMATKAKTIQEALSSSTE